MSDAAARDMPEQVNISDLPLQGQGPLPVPELGSVWLVWTPRGLCALRWPEQGPLPDGPPEAPLPPYLAEPLTRFFAGKAMDPALMPVHLHGTPFQVRVYEALRQVRRGTVRTYAGIAADLGSPRAMRAVGAANARNPLPVLVPCHRIVEKGNLLGGYSGGLERKVWLLGLEGVTVREGRVLPGQLALAAGWEP
jgi:methylated-DNA-[protein]-cysteine S-methyltransferase